MNMENMSLKEQYEKHFDSIAEKAVKAIKQKVIGEKIEIKNITTISDLKTFLLLLLTKLDDPDPVGNTERMLIHENAHASMVQKLEEKGNSRLWGYIVYLVKTDNKEVEISIGAHWGQLVLNNIEKILITAAPNLYGKDGFELGDDDRYIINRIKKDNPKAYKEAMARYEELRKEYMSIKEENKQYQQSE